MAHALQKYGERPPAPQDGVTLTLTEREARFLCALMGKIPCSYGHPSSSIYNALSRLKYGWPYKVLDVKIQGDGEFPRVEIVDV